MDPLEDIVNHSLEHGLIDEEDVEAAAEEAVNEIWPEPDGDDS